MTGLEGIGGEFLKILQAPAKVATSIGCAAITVYIFQILFQESETNRRLSLYVGLAAFALAIPHGILKIMDFLQNLKTKPPSRRRIQKTIKFASDLEKNILAEIAKNGSTQTFFPNHSEISVAIIHLKVLRIIDKYYDASASNIAVRVAETTLLALIDNAEIKERVIDIRKTEKPQRR